LTLANTHRKLGWAKVKSMILESPLELILGRRVETLSPSETLIIYNWLSWEVQEAINSPSELNDILEIGKFLSNNIPSIVLELPGFDWLEDRLSKVDFVEASILLTSTT